MQNTIFLNRQLKVIAPEENQTLSNTYVATALKNLEGLGFGFSKELITRVQTMSELSFFKFYKEILSSLKQMVGAHIRHKPMYPNFPSEVMEMDEATLYVNAILHYFTLEQPVKAIGERSPLVHSKELQLIQLGTEMEFVELMTGLMAAKTSISPTDKEDLTWFLSTYADIEQVLPKELPQKENMAFIIGTLLRLDKITNVTATAYLKTATDILRLAVALSDGDVSLGEVTRFRSFKNRERRFLLAAMELCPSLQLEDMVRYKNRWIRLGERLHPSAHQRRYPKANTAFNAMRNNTIIKTFNGRIEQLLEEKNISEAIALLTSRPGEFARRLDHLLRLADQNNHSQIGIAAEFEKVVSEVSTPVLLQVLAHFRHRNNAQDLRVFFPKGNVAKLFGKHNTLDPLSELVCQMMVSICESALRQRFSELPPVGKVFIDDNLTRYPVPFSQRSASKALRTLSRGSQLPLSDDDIVRFFVWWKEGKVNGKETGQVDVDLSAYFLDENWAYKEHISYTNLRSDYSFAVHSGDIVTAPRGASEFIDVNIPQALKEGCRYVMMNVYSFSEQPYKDLPECFAGWMGRNDGNTGEIFEPSTVQNKWDITADATIAVPLIIDLETRMVVWTDLSLTRGLSTANNIEGSHSALEAVGKAFMSFNKVTLHDLFRLHAESRGEIIEKKEDADAVFAEYEGITPEAIEVIISEYLV
ncbi:TerD family protein [Priestia koreensis]|uniref:TerD family protein n=1 Tax=Priestia koreensis TaxID=284581 RepID=UPI003CFC9AC4